MTMISAWMDAEEPDRTTAPGLYPRYPSGWLRRGVRTEATLAADWEAELRDLEAELIAEIDVVAELNDFPAID